jgi:hypothetical protein
MQSIDSYLKREINEKIDKIRSHPKFYEKKKKIILKELRTIGDTYSFWIENPELRRAVCLENKSPETLKKLSRKGIQSMHNGWNYLSNPNLTKDLIYQLGENDFGIVKSLNALILGDSSKKSCGFRTWRVDLNCDDYLPPEAEEIEEKMQEVCSRLQTEYSADPLTTAISWHLEGAAIQPFGNGNKRTFRLIQDKLLDEKDFPSAIIPAGEAKYYLNLLCKTLPAYEKKDFKGQREFYDYCASKVNNGLDQILNDLGLPSPQ